MDSGIGGQGETHQTVDGQHIVSVAMAKGAGGRGEEKTNVEPARMIERSGRFGHQPRRRNWRGQQHVKRYHWSAYGMLIPSLALVLAFGYYPPLVAVVYSFTLWDGLYPPIFNGVQNYEQVLRDRVFWISMEHLVVWTVLKLCLDIGVPLLVAVTIYHLRSERMQYIYRVAFVIPMVIPSVVGLLVWQYFYDPSFGLLDRLLHQVGLPQPDWIGNPHLALLSLIFMGFPYVAPFSLLIFYAGLQNVPEEIFESAQLDGIGRVGNFFRLEVPLVLGQIKLIMILTVIGLLQSIMTPLVMTDGGPGYATFMPGLYMYFAAFQNDEFGLGMAVAMIVFVLVMAVTLIQVKVIRPTTEFEV